ncbi:MAG: hypothetical protein AAGD07_22370, partial [Planctomycetota bacterium]
RSHPRPRQMEIAKKLNPGLKFREIRSDDMVAIFDTSVRVVPGGHAYIEDRHHVVRSDLPKF